MTEATDDLELLKRLREQRGGGRPLDEPCPHCGHRPVYPMYSLRGVRSGPVVVTWICTECREWACFEVDEEGRPVRDEAARQEA